MSKAVLEIMQLADSCFPSGGFAFSNGLESMAKLGYVKRMADFHQYLECYLEQLTTSELPFLNSAYLAAGAGDGAPASNPPHQEILTPAYIAVYRDWNAWLFLPAQRRGSLAQGQAWLRAIEETYATTALLTLRKNLLIQDLAIHFLMVFAASLKIIGITLVDAQNLFMHLALRDQLGAAVRLGLLGSLQAQKLHHHFIDIGEKYLQQHGDWTCEMAQRTAPMIELAQASHANLYSRLFQN